MTVEDVSEQNLGFKIQDNDLEDNITGAGVDFYRFGYNEKSRGRFPTMQNEVSTQYYGNERKPQFGRIINATMEKNIAFNPVNGLPWAMHWGKVFHSADAEPDKVHTIVPSPITVDLPKLATRWQTESVFRTALNTRVKGCNVRFVRGQPLASGASIVSKKVVNAALQSTHAPIYPTSESGLYDIKNGMTFKWDVDLAADGNGNNIYSSGGANEHDYSNILLNLSFSSTMINNQIKDANALYYDFLEGNYGFEISGSLLRLSTTDNEKIYLDAETQRDNQTFNNAHFKIFNGASKYLQIDMEDVILTNVELEHITIDDLSSKAQLYEFSGLVLSPVMTVLDGVNSSLYP